MDWLLETKLYKKIIGYVHDILGIKADMQN